MRESLNISALLANCLIPINKQTVHHLQNEGFILITASLEGMSPAIKSSSPYLTENI